MAGELAAGGGGGVATQLKIVGYVTANIEQISEGDWVLSRDQGDPDGPLVGGRISRKYRRIAGHLELVGIEDAGGHGQTLRTTDEHPFFVPDKGWTKSRLLEAGDGLAGPAEVCSIVTGNARQSHPEGVVVYNMEVEGSHTYFVRAGGADGEPVWVHNAQGYGQVSEKQRLPASNGQWTGEPGNSGWVSDLLEVQQVVGDAPIQYRFDPVTGRSYPNLRPWAQGEVEIPWMKGNYTTDFDFADEALARRWSWAPEQVEAYRINRGLTWHHVEDLRTMQLVPRALNGVPHVGGASIARG